VLKKLVMGMLIRCLKVIDDDVGHLLSIPNTSRRLGILWLIVGVTSLHPTRVLLIPQPPLNAGLASRSSRFMRIRGHPIYLEV
jgi:hypothetical protein